MRAFLLFPNERGRTHSFIYNSRRLLERFHVSDKSLRLILRQTFLRISRHVGRLLCLLALHDSLKELIIRLSGIEKLGHLRAMTDDALAVFVKSGGIYIATRRACPHGCGVQ